MRLQELAQATGGQLYGDDVMFYGVSTDTRTIQRGELFVALEGPNFNGHRFLAEAGNKSAVAALVRNGETNILPHVVVDDTRLGLGKLAGYWRQRFDCPLVAITGSNGKTTVKEMTGAILSEMGRVLVSSGNLNNDIGLPLVLCRLRPEHQYAVVEMGMNHLGEIDYLTRLACPKVAVITNAAAAHLEGLGSVEAVAEAKSEIFNGLTDDGIVVVNADDPFACYWRRRARGRNCITFGLQEPADVTINELRMERDVSHVGLHTPSGVCELSLHLSGRHNVLNALAASAAAIAAGADIAHIQRGLESVSPVSGRLQFKRGAGGSVVIDDSYNANPASMNAAIRVLAAAKGKTILVVGDMMELGEATKSLHQSVGKEAKLAGVDALFSLGELSEFASSEFGAGARHFDSRDSLIEALLMSMDANSTILIKGSRGMRMEEIVQAVQDTGVRH